MLLFYKFIYNLSNVDFKRRIPLFEGFALKYTPWYNKIPFVVVINAIALQLTI